MPVQESSQENDRERIRRKRLERLGSDNPDSPKSESSERALLRSVGSPPNSSAISEVMKPSGSSPPVQSFKRSSSSPRMQQFEVEDVVKVERKGKPWYGVIRWIGNLPNVEGSSAGIEMVWKVQWEHSNIHIHSCKLAKLMMYILLVLLCRKRKLKVDIQESGLGHVISHVTMAMGCFYVPLY